MTGVTVKLGATSLMYACQQGKESQVNEIIQTKPNTILERERSLKTALHYCAESGDGGVESAAALLRVAPQLVFAQDQDGYTALHLAVIAGNVQLAKLLISQGADVNTSDNEGHTSAHWATVCGEIECLELILRKKADPNIGDMHGGCPLHYAAQMCGPGSEMPGDRRLGMTALRLLINHLANPNNSDHHGRQPILWAASAGSSEAILVLTNAGANVEAADKDGLTALHCAASRGHTDCVETLISLCNAEADVIDNNGCSALFYAVTLGHADCTQALLNHGANTNRQDRKGRTAMHCGAAKGQMETLKVVWSRGGNLWTRTARGDYPLHEAVTSGRTDLVLWLLSLRPDAVNAPNNDGRCPIHLAAIHNNVEMCKVLLDAGSLVNPVMRTAKGMLATPLDAALHKGHRGTAKYLQVHGGVPAARLNSESAVLRGPNTRNSGGQNQQPLDNEKEKDGMKEQMSSKINMLSSPQEKVQMSGQKHILEVYVEDGVMIRRINNSQVGEAEDRAKRRRRRKRKTKYAVDKNYLRSKEKNGRRGYEESTEDDEYSSQDLSIGECRFKTESDSDQIPIKRNTEALVRDSLNVITNETNSQLLPTSVTRDGDDAKQMLSETCIKIKPEKKELSNNDSYTDPNYGTAADIEIIPIKENDLTKNEEKNSENEVIHSETSSNSILAKKELTVLERTKEDDNEEANLETKYDITLDKNSTEQALENLNEIKDIIVNNEDNNNNLHSEIITESDTHGSTTVFANHNSNVDMKNYVQTVDAGRIDECGYKESRVQIKDTENESKVKEIEENKEEKGNDFLQDKNDAKNVYINNEENRERFNSIFLEENKIGHKMIDGFSHTEIENHTSIENEGKNGNRVLAITENDETSEQTDELHHEKMTDVGKSKDNVLIENHVQGVNKEFKHEELETNDKVQILNKSEESKLFLEVPNEENLNTDFNLIKTENLETEHEQILEEKSNEPKHQIEIIKAETTGKEENILKNEEQSNDQESHMKSFVNEELIHSNKNNTDLSDPEEEISGSGTMYEEQNIYQELSINDTDTKQLEGSVTNSQIISKVNGEENSNKSNNFKIGKKIEKNDRIHKGKKDRGLIKVFSDEKLPLTIQEKTKPKRKEWRRQRSSESWEPQSISPQLDEESAVFGSKLPGNVQHSGIDPSPRRKRYDQGTGLRTKSQIPRMCDKEHGDKNRDIPISTVSVTQAVQYSMRKYHLERRIFHQLLELKRLQIRAGRSSEGVLVKRLVDDYRRAGLMLGLQQYNGIYTFRAFEKYLYDQLRLLQSSERRIIPRLKSSDDLEKLTAALKKTRPGQDILTSIPSNPALCTYQTHRCHHATHAYTGVPCAAYIKRNHHTMPKPGSFLPKLVNDEGHSELAKTLRFVDPSRPLTLELSHGSEKQVITLPTEKLDKSKKYFVTFTIKTGNQKKAEGSHAHTHASSV